MHIWNGTLFRSNRLNILPIGFWVLSLLFFGTQLYSQSPSSKVITLQFEPIFDGKAFHLKAQPSSDLKEKEGNPDNQSNSANQQAYQLNGQDLEFDALRFYLSNFSLVKDGETIWLEPNSYHLLDAAQPNTFQISFQLDKKLPFDALKFDLGIDSATNVSGAFGGDLDPTKGMYWAWQSGYINFKLEGKSPDCPSRNNAFQYHLGGYLPPFDCVQAITLPIAESQSIKKKRKCKGKRASEKIEVTTDSGTPEQQIIRIQFDIADLLSPLDLSKEYKVMSPSTAGKEMSIQLASLFHIYEED